MNCIHGNNPNSCPICENESRTMRAKPREWTKADDMAIIKHFPVGGSMEVASLISGVSRTQILNRVCTLRKNGATIPMPHLEANIANPEMVIDGYDDVPYWCRQSTRKQISVEPRFDGDHRHTAKNFEYDQD